MTCKIKKNTKVVYDFYNSKNVYGGSIYYEKKKEEWVFSPVDSWYYGVSGLSIVLKKIRELNKKQKGE